MTISDDDLRAWGWEEGASLGRQLATDSDHFVAVTARPVDTPAALRVYSTAFLRAFIRAYRAEIQRSLSVRADIAAWYQRHLPDEPPSPEAERNEP